MNAARRASLCTWLSINAFRKSWKFCFKPAPKVNQRNSLGETPLGLLDAYEPRPVGDEDARRIRSLLLRWGAQDDLFSLARAGDLDTLSKLLDETPKLMLARSDETGFTLLATAARSGRPAVAGLLIERGAPVDAANEQDNTPLWFACQSSARAADRIAVAEKLLEGGAEVDRRCEEGTTALHFAAWRGPVGMVELLLSRGATKSVADNLGRTALAHAEAKPRISGQG